MSTERAAVLAGLGGYLPPRLVTNDELCAGLDSTPEWIESRTGIRERRHVDPGTATSDLAVEAGARALRSAGITSVDVVVVATTSPDRTCPATAPEVAMRLGVGTVAAYDVASACGGFAYGLATASGLIAAGIADTVLLVGAEAFSVFVDPADRATRPIFGDGAGAAVLRAGRPSEPGAIGPFDLGSDGEGVALLAVPAGGSRQHDGVERYLAMDGRAVYQNAVKRMTRSATAVLDRAGWPVETVDSFVGHQANIRILHTVADRLGVPRERAVVNIDRVGNALAASIPLALAEANALGRLTLGDRVLLTAFGAGFSWGSTVLTWPRLTCGNPFDN
ncbi:beta-ketoacyl-ACP synthase III [Kutzneria sp. NPDC052558]|uniref:beta-ketoacyl-ACP synthase III n=1 Tax=Kutzneria sp. NPDC052558 TaxID=3364121 RepID=UPI0037C9BAEB